MGPELVLLTARLCVLMAKARVALPSPASPRLDHPQSPLQPPGHRGHLPPLPIHIAFSHLTFSLKQDIPWNGPTLRFYGSKEKT